MEIIDYTYRKPKWLEPLDPTKIDTAVVHHTGNNNSIKINTDYHIDSNAWSWLGYSYYIFLGVIYKVRGMEYKDAGVRGHNDHTVNIAVQGNYNKDYISKQDMKALEWLIRYLKKENPNIKYVKGHNEFNSTNCPGQNINVKEIEERTSKELIDYDTIIQDNELLNTQNNYLVTEIQRLDRIIRKDREKYDELKKIYKEKVEELQNLRVNNHI